MLTTVNGGFLEHPVCIIIRYDIIQLYKHRYRNPKDLNISVPFAVLIWPWNQQRCRNSGRFRENVQPIYRIIVTDEFGINIQLQINQREKIGSWHVENLSKDIKRYTLQGTNISPQNGILKMMFLFPRWDMLIPWRVDLNVGCLGGQFLLSLPEPWSLWPLRESKE